MPINQINTTFSTAQETAILAAIASINTNFPFAVNLTADERSSLSTIDNARFPYVQRTMDIHAPGNPTLVSAFAGTLADATNDWTLMKQCDKFLILIEVVREKLMDTRMLTAHELWKFFLEFYATVQRAAANNVPGADAILSDLETLFAGQGPQGGPTP